MPVVLECLLFLVFAAAGPLSLHRELDTGASHARIRTLKEKEKEEIPITQIRKESSGRSFVSCCRVPLHLHLQAGMEITDRLFALDHGNLFQKDQPSRSCTNQTRKPALLRVFSLCSIPLLETEVVDQSASRPSEGAMAS